MDNKGFIARKYRTIAKWIEPGSEILEVGCGTAQIKDLVSDAKYVGIDASDESVTALKKSGHMAYNVNLNTDEPPKMKQKFDYVLFLDILEHLLNPAKVLADYSKFLKKDGKIIVSLPNDYHLLNKIRFITNKKIVERPFWGSGHIHIYPIHEGRRFIENQGFQITKQTYLATHRPRVIPEKVRDFMGRTFPKSFARITLYVAQKK